VPCAGTVLCHWLLCFPRVPRFQGLDCSIELLLPRKVVTRSTRSILRRFDRGCWSCDECYCRLRRESCIARNIPSLTIVLTRRRPILQVLPSLATPFRKSSAELSALDEQVRRRPEHADYQRIASGAFLTAVADQANF